eukprot:SAG31_NODE_1714_length_7462_cov_29.616596_4_plen_36_part_00
MPVITTLHDLAHVAHALAQQVADQRRRDIDLHESG